MTSKGLGKEVQQSMEAHADKVIKRRADCADDFLTALDNYLTATREYEVAAKRCEDAYGNVIYDVVWQEQEARDKARAEVRKAVIAIQR